MKLTPPPAPSQPISDPKPESQRFASWGWGALWGISWATLLNIFAGSPFLDQAESLMQAHLWRWRGPQTGAPEVVIVGIDGQVAGEDRSVDFSLERSNFAALVLRLLQEAQAHTVVLNLPSSFVVPQTLGNEDLDAPLRQVVQQHADRLVLATRTNETFRQSEISVYNHFFPFSSLDFRYLVPPEQVQGFVQDRLDPLGRLREARLTGQFLRRDSRTTQAFSSVEILTLAKAAPDRAAKLLGDLDQTIIFNPLGPSGQIPVIPIEQVCPPRLRDSCLGPIDRADLAMLRDKIVLVGFVGGYPETFPVTLADGSQVASVEAQGQILSSLLRQDRYHQLSPWGRQGVIVGLGVGTGLLVVALGPGGWRQRGEQTQRLPRFWLLLPLVAGGSVIGLYWGWAALQLTWWRGLWPLIPPILTSGLTTLSVLITLTLRHNQQRIQDQQHELERLRQAEREAVIYQARKLLYRVATDIHDHELQELKLVMDAVEGWQWDYAQLPVDGVLNQLEHIGAGIRHQLHDVRSLASKLGISPSLKEGLHQGLRLHLAELETTGALHLTVMADLQPLQEPNTSAWFDAREDILRFFREAIANVIHHAQPPKGNATTLTVTLLQQGDRCHLQVTNDGQELVTAPSGGYGTKAMNTTANQLPGGHWHRQTEATGTIVSLAWDMHFGNPNTA